MLRVTILSLENEYRSQRRDLENSGASLSEQVLRYIDAVVFLHSGLFYWSSYCGRYDRNVSGAAHCGTS